MKALLLLALALPLAAQHNGTPQPHDKGLGVAALDQGHGIDGSPAGGWNVREIPTQSRHGFDSYRWSQIALGAAVALDIASTYGGIELNPLVGRGRFTHSMAVKSAAFTGAGMLAQELAVRRYPKMRGWVAQMNFGIAGARGFVAVWNFTR